MIRIDPYTQKLVIEIFDNAPLGGDERGEEPSTLGLLPTDTPRFLRRPRPPLSKLGGFINFYDLGYYKGEDGNYIDDSEQFIPVGGDVANFAQNNGLYVPDLPVKINQALDVIPSLWETKFKKISKADGERYRWLQTYPGEELTLGNPNWTDKGLKIPTPFPEPFFLDGRNSPQKGKAVYYDPGNYTSGGDVEYGGNGLFYFLTPALVKVTAEPDYEADALEAVELSNDNFSVFLNRVIWKLECYKLLAADETPLEALNMFYSALPYSIFGNDALKTERDYLSPEFTVDYIKAMEVMPSNRKFLTDGTIFTSNGSGAGFYDASPTYSYILRASGNNAGAGNLHGAIKQGDNWFYFWYAG